MYLEFDANRFPELGDFRKACLAGRLEEMKAIAASGHDWYTNENPEQLPMDKLSKVFRAQHYASENMVAQLRELVNDDSWVVNHSWTHQRWLPLSQAAWAGHAEAVEALLELGADATLRIGSSDDEQSIAELARNAGHDRIAELLDNAKNA